MRFDEQFLTDKHGNNIIKTFHSSVPAGKREYREHHHTECELSLFISGEGVYSVGKHEYEFKSGDIFLFNSDEIHCITDIYCKSSFDLLNIHFEPRILWSENDINDLSLLKIFFARSNSFENRIDRKNISTPHIQNLILQLESELKSKQEGFEIASKTALFSILLCLLRNYGYVKPENVFAGNENTIRQISHALQFIDNHLAESITLSQLSDISCMSKTYFSTMFKKFNGISPWDYITIKRIEKAIDLIKTTDKTKIEISEMCGFSSMSNFYKAFSKITGKKPSQF